MPLARLENFLKNLNGNTLYVDPNELDATDSIENRGNSRLRPFKTIQRALLEAARFSYVAGSSNDLFDQTTILISPGTHYIDNRPGYYVDASNNLFDVNNSSVSITEFNILSNFDITDSSNELYIYNSVDGGVIIPKGTSLVASDLRKTKIRPLFVPDPNNNLIEKTSIFRLTGSCYFFGFSIYDGDPLGKVYNTYSSSNKVTPSYSHHKLTAFEYADGVNKIGTTGHTDLETYYYKLSKGFGQQSGRDIIDGYLNFEPNIDEYRIVGDLGIGTVDIDSTAGSVKSGDGVNGTNVITVTTADEHGLSPLTPILISGVGTLEGSPTTTEYNGNFLVSQVLSPTQFTYLTVQVPTGSLTPSTSGATVKVISDTTTSSSPYVFNCSLKSVYGMNGLHADGSKSTGFRSMVTAQFTGISLQKDDDAFVRYNEDTGTYLDQSSLTEGSEFLHQNINSVYKPDWASFHIKASNDAFIQCVSIFAIGYADQFIASEGGDQSITNSNSNFGQRALYAEGFKDAAFPKDDYGFITHVIPPKDFIGIEQNIDTFVANSSLANSTTKLYINEYNDVLNVPQSKFRNFSIGGKVNDKIYYSLNRVEYSASITPSYKIEKEIISINASSNLLELEDVVGISTGLPVKIISKNSILPDGIEHEQTYFARVDSANNIKLYENLSNCNSNISPVDIKNSVGFSASNLYLTSRVSELSAGDVGSPIQWDDTAKNWYIGIAATSGFVTNLINNPSIYIKRIIDTRSNSDKIYRVRYVIPKDSTAPSVPATGFIFQKSSAAIDSSYAKASDVFLESNNELSTIRNKNIIIDAHYSGGTATIVTKNHHNLKVGNKVSIYNLKSSNEPSPVGLGSGTGYNGSFEVASVIDDLTFTYSIPVNPGTITAGISTIASWYSNVTSSYKAPPYTIYDDNRDFLPYFACDQIKNHYQIYSIKQIQKYVKDSSDGVYQVILDCFKNTPISSPFNTTQYKFGQSTDNIYPKFDYDNLTVDPEPSTTAASRKTIGKVDINDPYLSSTKEILIDYLKDFNFGNSISGFVKSGNNVTITTSDNHGLSGIRRLTGATIGSGYTNGTYYDIPLTGGTGSNATVNVVVSGGVPTTFQVANPGSGYTLNDELTVRGIPGSTNVTTVTASLLNFSSQDSDLIQILGATDPNNNGPFIISSVTDNTITFENPNGSTEATTNAVVVNSGVGYVINSASHSAGITTVTTSSPHSFAPGNKVIFSSGSLGICTVKTVPSTTTFSIEGNASSATKVYSIGLIPTLKDTNSSNENLNTRNFAVYDGYKSKILSAISNSSTSFSVENISGLKKGDFIQIDNEIMLITRISGGTANVKRALLGTQAVSHPTNSSIKTINVLPVELRRPSILRASGHTFEYVGFGPGNYSTGMPSNQTKVLSNDEVIVTQALPNRGGTIFYSGMNSNGELFIGKKKWNASTGDEVTELGFNAEDTLVVADEITVNKITVNQEINASTASERVKLLTVLGSASFESGITVNGGSLTFTGVGAATDGDIYSTGGSDGNFGIWNTTNSGYTVFLNKNSGGTYNDILTLNHNSAAIDGSLSVSGNISLPTTGSYIGWSGNSDYAFIRFNSTSDSNPPSQLEIAIGDNSSSSTADSIVVNQYNESNVVARTLKLLDNSGNTVVPGSLTCNGATISSGSLLLTGTSSADDGDIYSTGGSDGNWALFNTTTGGATVLYNKNLLGNYNDILTLYHNSATIDGSLTVNVGAYIDQIQVGIANPSLITTTSGNLVLNSANSVVEIPTTLDVATAAYIDNVQIGVNGSSEIDTTSGNLVLDSASGTTLVDDNLTVSGDVTVTAPSEFIGYGTIPLGGIIMWSGSIANIPTGWQLCNGSNGTPNLIDRFIVGAGSGYAVAATGGSANAVVVSHTHTATTTISDPGHIHTGFLDAAGNLIPYVTTEYNLGSPGSGGTTSNSAIDAVATTLAGTNISASTSISTEGSSATNANLPPYYALAFIMRVA